MTDEAQIIAAAARIFDLFGGPQWRERADLSDIYESADWAQAVLYARAAFASDGVDQAPRPHTPVDDVYGLTNNPFKSTAQEKG